MYYTILPLLFLAFDLLFEPSDHSKTIQKVLGIQSFTVSFWILTTDVSASVILKLESLLGDLAFTNPSNITLPYLR